MAEVCERLDGLVTSTQIERIFGRSELTILHWRQRLGMPYVRIPGDGRDTIRFDLKKVIEWADSQGKSYRIPEGIGTQGGIRLTRDRKRINVSTNGTTHQPAAEAESG